LINLYTYLLACFLVIPGLLRAQIITVQDRSTLQPIEDVLIENQDHSFQYTTNSRGQVAVTGLFEDDLLTFSHPSFEVYLIPVDQLKLDNFKVALQPRIITIDEVVVSANRWEQEKRQTPNRIASIGATEVVLKNPQTSADMLAHTGQVFVQKSQLGGGSPMIRGFAANSVLIVVDGIRMNNAIFRSGNLQNIISIDPFSLESTEVLFGPGSVMYGSDALGGVMHFKTRDPGFTNSPKPLIKANSIMRYSSANQEKTGHVDFQVQGKRLSLFTSVTYSDFNHLKTGNKRTQKFPDYGKRLQYVKRIDQRDQVLDNPDFNRQVYSGYNQFNILNKLAARLGDQADVTYTFNYSTTSDIPRYDRLIETDENGNFRSAEWYYGPQNWLSNSLALNLYRPSKLYDAAKITLALQNLKESRHDRDLNSDWLRNRTEKVNLITLNLDLEKDLGEKNRLFYGVEGFFNQVSSYGQRANINDGQTEAITPRYPDGGSDYYSFAAYFSHKWHPSKKLALTSGIRYSIIGIDARYQESASITPGQHQLQLNNNAFNGSLGLAWVLSEKWQVNSLFSTGFRSPNIDDIAKIFDGTNGVVTVPNIELKPEYSYNYEIGITRKIQDKVRISATAFYTNLERVMVQRNYEYQGTDSIYLDGEQSRTQSLVNAGSARIYGGSAQLEWSIIPELVARSSFTVTKGSDSKNQPLRHTTPNFGFVGITFQKFRFTGELNFRFSGKREFEDLPLVEQQKTHLYTSDGALAWQTLNFNTTFAINETFSITGGLENILNQHYRPYSSGISAAGRNLIIALKASL